MKDLPMQKFVCLLGGVILMSLAYACANIGTPNGGPYDEQPPKFVSSLPLPNQTNYQGRKVEILFDELIQIEKPSENVIITPPQMELPVIRTSGKKAVVELKDTLKPNTTYTIDFTNSIADNNEKNVFENFSFAFSTGETIDTMQISGVLLNAENLEPMPGITIGLHENLSDTAFLTLPFVRTSRTNDRGQFTIRNIAAGSYHVFALNDVNRDYRFDQPGEEIAFLDSLIVPSCELASRQDTIWKDSLTIDTIRTVEYTHFFPDQLKLLLFKEDFARQYMTKPERTDEHFFTVHFNAPLDTVPVPVPLNFEPAKPDWFFVQTIEEGAGVNYWLVDSMLWKQDTLRMELTYPKSDSLNILRPQTDTLQVVMRHKAAEKSRKRKKDKPEPIVFLGMQVKAPSSMDLFDTISVTFNEPVLKIDSAWFKLEQLVDSVWQPAAFTLFPDTTNSLNFYLLRPWMYEESYQLTVDSAVIYSLFGKWNNTFTTKFSIKKESEYGHLYLNIAGLDTTAAYVELLNSNDQPVRKSKVKDGGALFMDLKPDKYYARLIVDKNENGRWDPGRYSENLHPEAVYYSSKFYEIKPNWQIEETWNIHDLPLDKQKPLDVTKNKPKEATKVKRNYKDEGKRMSTSSNRGMGGFSF